MGMHRFVELDSNGAPLKPAAPPGVARLEPARGLMWGPTFEQSMTWEEAKKACAEFRLFGFTDWRLPTVEELFLLADRTRHDPAIDTEAFPDTKSAGYWTSSPDASAPAEYAWSVNFYSGLTYLYYQYDRAFVRAVRSASPAGQ